MKGKHATRKEVHVIASAVDSKASSAAAECMVIICKAMPCRVFLSPLGATHMFSTTFHAAYALCTTEEMLIDTKLRL